jgi:hypothetical protein
MITSCVLALAWLGGCRGDAGHAASRGSGSTTTGAGGASNGGGSAAGGGHSGGGAGVDTPCVASFGEQVLGSVTLDSAGDVLVGGDSLMKLDRACKLEWRFDGVLSAQTFSKAGTDLGNGIVAIGPTASLGGATETVLTALDPDGTARWTELSGIVGTSDFALDPAGRANLAFSVTDGAASAIVVRHLYPGGTVHWETQFVQGNLNGATFGAPRIAADAQGNVFLAAGCGATAAPCAISFGTTTLPEGNGFLLAKLGASGDVQWATFYPHDGAVGGCRCEGDLIFPTPTALLVDPAGDVVLQGRGDVDFGAARPATDYLAKLDGSGHTIWSTGLDDVAFGTDRTCVIAPSGDIWSLVNQWGDATLQRFTSEGVESGEPLVFKRVVATGLAVDAKGFFVMSGSNRAGADLGLGHMPSGSFVARIAS